MGYFKGFFNRFLTIFLHLKGILNYAFLINLSAHLSVHLYAQCCFLHKLCGLPILFFWLFLLLFFQSHNS